MILLDITEINKCPRTYLFSVQVDADAFADVSCNTQTGLIYALQHTDGKIFYNHAGETIVYPMGEEKLIEFVRKYTIRCEDIPYGTPVVFLTKMRGNAAPLYMNGTTDIMAAHMKEIGVSWLEGYKNRNDFVPFRDVVAIYHKDGFAMQFDNISGKSLIVMQ